jgi:protein-tyrosine phosphatase
VREWKRVGAVIQMDAVTLFGRSPLSALARELVEEGLVDCMASDNHADSRSLAAARTWLREVASERHAELLTRENPGRVLRDEPVLPVEPVERRRGLGGRLRELARSLAGGRRRD